MISYDEVKGTVIGWDPILGLFTLENLPIKIYYAREGLAYHNRLEMLQLIRYMVHILYIIQGREKSRMLFDAFCEKPYFPEQLRVTPKDLNDYTGRDIDEEELENIYNCIIKRFVELQGEWPYSYKKYMNIVFQGILDAYPDWTVNIPEWDGLIDDYGNYTDHAKAIQYRRVPLNIMKLSDLGIETFEELEQITGEANLIDYANSLNIVQAAEDTTK